MDIILTDYAPLTELCFENVKIDRVKTAQMERYNHKEDVVAIAGSRALAINGAKYEFPKLKLVQLTSAGFDGVPCEEYAKKSISVANAGDVYSAPIAETVVLGLLLMAKKLRENPNNRHFKIDRHFFTITEIKGKRILILGTGNIGTAIVNRLSGFEAVIDGYNRSGKAKAQFERIISGKKELISEIGQYDYIISTLPDSPETRGFVDREMIRHMNRRSVIVNVGRRAVFDEDALFTALKNGQLEGAVLDMFEFFPNPVTNKFRRLKNTIVLPGVSAISKEVDIRLKELIMDNIRALLEQKSIRYVINGD